MKTSAKKTFMWLLVALTAICLAMGAVFGNAGYKASADGDENLTETKVSVSTDGEHMLLVTVIKDVTDVYEVGYDFTGEVTKEFGDTTKYYTSITVAKDTANEKTWTAADIFGETYENGKMIVWEIAYSPANAYNYTAYYIKGTRVGETLYTNPEGKKTGTARVTEVPTYTVTLDKDNDTANTVLENIAYGTTAAALYEAAMIPEKTGYTFEGWYIGETKVLTTDTVTGNLTLKAKYTANTNTAYKINVYEQSAFRADYSAEPTRVVNRTGTTDTQADETSYAAANCPDGFVVDNGVKTASVLTGNIEADGSLELSLYYRKYDNDESYAGKSGSGTDTSYDGLPSSITVDNENYFGESLVSAKIHMEAGTYKTCEALVTNVDLFSAFENGDFITYYLKIGQAYTSATKDGEYSTAKTTFTLSQVPNPSGWGTNPVYIENASTHETVTSLTAGVWYKVVYIASNANNSTFKGTSENAGKCMWYYHDSTTFTHIDFYVDGLTVTKELENMDPEGLTFTGPVGTNGLAATATIDHDNVYGNGSTASLKLETVNGTYRTSEGLITNNLLFGDLVAGNTITYYIKIGEVTKTDDDTAYNDAIQLGALPNFIGWNVVPTSVTLASDDSAVTEVTAGVWYKVVCVANTETNGTFKGTTQASGSVHFYQGQCPVKVNMTFYIDGITVAHAA